MKPTSWYKKAMRNLKFSLIRLLRVQNGARVIALGLVAGFLPCWFPTFGIGPVLSVGLTKFIGGSVIAALLAASIGSFLWPLLFYLNYFTGALFVGRKPMEHAPEVNFDRSDYVEPIEHVQSWGEIGMSFVWGSIINSIVFSIVAYFVIFYLFKRYREKWLVRLVKRKQGKSA